MGVEVNNRCAAMWLVLLSLCLCPVLAGAHDVGQSYLYLTIADGKVLVRSEIAIKELNLALGLQLPEDLTATQKLLTPHQQQLANYVFERIDVAPNGVQQSEALLDVELFSTSFNQFVQVNFSVPTTDEKLVFIDVAYQAVFDVVADHTAFLVVENNWLTSTFDNEAGISLTFTEATPQGRLDLTDNSIWRGFLGMVQMGMHHIWIGIDHVLFLLALLLPSVLRRDGNRWVPVSKVSEALWQVVKIVTIFTVAHTITLSLASLGLISLSSRVVESIIALSIAVVAIDILRPTLHRWTYLVVLLFGLFHGFGFASVLGELPIPANYQVLSLLGFNLGVEIGQLAIVIVAVPILFYLSKWSLYLKWIMPLSACALIVISLYWFVERGFAIDLPAGALLHQLLAWL